MKRSFIRFSILSAVLCLFFTACKDGDTIYDPVSLPDVEIVIQEQSEGQVQVLFKPGEGTAKFIYAIGGPNDRDKFVSGALESEVSEGAGEVTETFRNLKDGLQYVIYAMAYDQADRKGAVSTANVFFSIGGDFSVEPQYVSDRSTGFRIYTDLNIYSHYRYFLGTAADRDKVLAQTVGESREELGNFTVNYFELTPSSEYVFYALATTRYGEQEFIEYPFTTAAAGSVPSVEFTWGGDAYFPEMTFTPNSHAGKVLMMASEEYNTVDYWIDNEDNDFKGDVVAALEVWYAQYAQWGWRMLGHLDQSLSGTLTTSFENESHVPGQEYVVYAVSYDAQGKAANVQKWEYTVPFDESAPVATASINLITATLDEVVYEVTPGAGTVAVYAGAVYKDIVEEEVPELDIQAIFEYYVSYNGIYVGNSTAPVEFKDTEELEAGRPVLILVIPANKNGEADFGALVTHEFTIPAP